MSRPGTFTLPTNSREQLRQDMRQAAMLRETYPQLSELRLEFNYDDGTPRPPSLQSYFHFPAARCLFRYACPCHSCNGTFDLAGLVDELVKDPRQSRLTRRVTLSCEGQRPRERGVQEDCPVRATVRITARLQSA